MLSFSRTELDPRFRTGVDPRASEGKFRRRQRLWRGSLVDERAPWGSSRRGQARGLISGSHTHTLFRFPWCGVRTFLSAEVGRAGQGTRGKLGLQNQPSRSSGTTSGRWAHGASHLQGWILCQPRLGEHSAGLSDVQALTLWGTSLPRVSVSHGGHSRASQALEICSLCCPAPRAPPRSWESRRCPWAALASSSLCLRGHTASPFLPVPPHHAARTGRLSSDVGPPRASLSPPSPPPRRGTFRVAQAPCLLPYPPHWPSRGTAALPWPMGRTWNHWPISGKGPGHKPHVTAGTPLPQTPSRCPML